MASQTVIKVELQGLQDLSQALDSQRVKEKVANVIKGIITEYLGDHFDKSSEGNGDWKPLSEATIRGRRPAARIGKKNAEQTSIKQHFASRAAILKDTGQLYAALNPLEENAPGREECLTIENGKVTFEFGYGGNDQWIPPKKNDKEDEEPREKKDKKPKKEREPITISALACIHHYGAPSRNLPARPILVPLDEETNRAIETMVEKIILMEAK